MTELNNEPKSVLEHIRELKSKIFISLGAVVIGAIITHLFHEKIIAFLLYPVGSQPLIFLSPLEPFLFIFKIDFIGGIIIGFPVIIWSLFSYITPALPIQSQRLVRFFYLTSTLLLFLGLAYALFVTIPLSLKFLFSITVVGIQNTISAQSYISFFIGQALMIMGVFQVPIIIIGGVYIGFFKTHFLSSKRPYIYLIITIALAILTPTADVFNLAIVLIPCLAIFEISLIGGKIVEAFKKKKHVHDAIEIPVDTK